MGHVPNSRLFQKMSLRYKVGEGTLIIIFNMKSRTWLLTLNNPELEGEEYMRSMFEQLKAAYVCGQLEQGAEGTPHFQMFVNFKEPVRASKIKKFDNKLHIDIVKQNNGADDYCLKEETRAEGPWEFGRKPVRRNNKKDWEEVWKKAKEGKIEEIDPQIRIRHYNSL